MGLEALGGVGAANLAGAGQHPGCFPHSDIGSLNVTPGLLGVRYAKLVFSKIKE